MQPHLPLGRKTDTHFKAVDVPSRPAGGEGSPQGSGSYGGKILRSFRDLSGVDAPDGGGKKKEFGRRIYVQVHAGEGLRRWGSERLLSRGRRRVCLRPDCLPLLPTLLEPARSPPLSPPLSPSLPACCCDVPQIAVGGWWHAVCERSEIKQADICLGAATRRRRPFTSRKRDYVPGGFGSRIFSFLFVKRTT